MCGLFGGYYKRPLKNTNRLIAALGVAMAERGRDSTGIVNILDEEGKATIRKDTVDACEFFMNGSRKVPDNVIGHMGHTRYATIGAVTKANAHPFHYGNIIGMHNGFVSNYKDIGTFDVDSMAIFYLLDKCNNNYVEALKLLEGSIAAVWTDLRNRYIYMVRHKNPLFIFHGTNFVFWCSELFPLQMIACNNNIKGVFVELEQDKVYVIDRELQVAIEDVKFSEEVKAYKTSYKRGMVWDYKSRSYVWPEDLNENDYREFEKQEEFDFKTRLSGRGTTKRLVSPVKKKVDKDLDPFTVKNIKKWLDGLKKESGKKHKKGYRKVDKVYGRYRFRADKYGCGLCKKKIDGFGTFYFATASHQIICTECAMDYLIKDIQIDLLFIPYLIVDKGK